MRKLHVVGFTSELDGLIFSTRKGSKSGSFVVAIGDELLDKLAEVERLRNGEESSDKPGGERASRRQGREPGPARPQSELTPREIQARLRAGRSIDEVAKEARCTREWVERFAAPILAEQAQVVDLARSLTYSKARLGESALSLGESVSINLVDKGVLFAPDEFDAGWSAFQVHDGVWLVRFAYRSRGRLQQAAWEVAVAAGRLTAVDRLASDLAYVDPGRRRRAGGDRAEESAEGLAEPAAVDVTPAEPSARRRAGVARRPPSRRALAGAAPQATRRRAPKTSAAKTARNVTPSTSSRRTRPAPARTTGTTKAAGTARSTPRGAATPRATKRVPRGGSPTKASAGRPTAKRTVAKAPAKRAAAKRVATSTARRRAASGAAKTATSSAAKTPSKAVGTPGIPVATGRPAGPRFGTDGSLLPSAGGHGPGRGTGGGRRSAAPRPAGPPSGRAEPHRRSPANPSPPPERVSTPSESGNGNRPAPVRFNSARLRRPASSEPPPPSGFGERPPDNPGRGGRPPATVEPDTGSPPDDRSEPATPLGARASIFGEEPSGGAEPRPTPPPAIALDSAGLGDDEDDNGERGGSDDEDAFVIRPRISAKQASELTFSPERPRRLRLRQKDSLDPRAGPSPFSPPRD